MIIEFIAGHTPDPQEAAVREAMAIVETIGGYQLYAEGRLCGTDEWDRLHDVIRSLLPASGVERRDLSEIDTTFDIWAVRGKMINQFRHQGESWKWMSSYDSNVPTGELPGHGRLFQCAPEHTPDLLRFLAGLIDGANPNGCADPDNCPEHPKPDPQAFWELANTTYFKGTTESPQPETEKTAPFFGPVPAEDQADPNAKLRELRKWVVSQPTRDLYNLLDQIDKLLNE